MTRCWVVILVCAIIAACGDGGMHVWAGRVVELDAELSRGHSVAGAGVRAGDGTSNRANVKQHAGVRVNLGSSVTDELADRHFATLNSMVHSDPSVRAEVRDAATVHAMRNGLSAADSTFGFEPALVHQSEAGAGAAVDAATSVGDFAHSGTATELERKLSPDQMWRMKNGLDINSGRDEAHESIAGVSRRVIDRVSAEAAANALRMIRLDQPLTTEEEMPFKIYDRIRARHAANLAAAAKGVPPPHPSLVSSGDDEDDAAAEPALMNEPLTAASTTHTDEAGNVIFGAPHAAAVPVAGGSVEMAELESSVQRTEPLTHASSTPAAAAVDAASRRRQHKAANSAGSLSPNGDSFFIELQAAAHRHSHPAAPKPLPSDKPADAQQPQPPQRASLLNIPPPPPPAMPVRPAASDVDATLKVDYPSYANFFEFLAQTKPGSKPTATASARRAATATATDEAGADELHSSAAAQGAAAAAAMPFPYPTAGDADAETNTRASPPPSPLQTSQSIDEMLEAAATAARATAESDAERIARIKSISAAAAAGAHASPEHYYSFVQYRHPDAIKQHNKQKQTKPAAPAAADAADSSDGEFFAFLEEATALHAARVATKAERAATAKADAASAPDLSGASASKTPAPANGPPPPPATTFVESGASAHAGAGAEAGAGAKARHRVRDGPGGIGIVYKPSPLKHPPPPPVPPPPPPPPPPALEAEGGGEEFLEKSARTHGGHKSKSAAKPKPTATATASPAAAAAAAAPAAAASAGSSKPAAAPGAGASFLDVSAEHPLFERSGSIPDELWRTTQHPIAGLYHPTAENVAPFPAQRADYPPFAADAGRAPQPPPQPAAAAAAIRRKPAVTAPAAAAAGSAVPQPPRRPVVPSAATAGRAASLNAATPAPPPPPPSAAAPSTTRRSLSRKGVGALQP